MRSPTKILRGFVSIDEGQVHYRTAGVARPDAPPLVMFHASPGSAKMLEPLIAKLAEHRLVIAPDTLGNGDSAAPAMGAPDLPYFAEAHLRALDALGVAQFDAYGAHTGANMAIELAVAHRERVRRVVLDGVSYYTDVERADMLAHHATPIPIDAHGHYLQRVWHFVRDGYLFWPWYKHGATNLRGIGLPSPDALYDKVLEVLKAARTYHLPYQAAIAYDKTARLQHLAVPTLLACAKSDMLLEYLEDVAKLIPNAEMAVTEGVGNAAALDATAATFSGFLDAA